MACGSDCCGSSNHPKPTLPDSNPSTTDQSHGAHHHDDHEHHEQHSQHAHSNDDTSTDVHGATFCVSSADGSSIKEPAGTSCCGGSFRGQENVGCPRGPSTKKTNEPCCSGPNVGATCTSREEEEVDLVSSWCGDSKPDEKQSCTSLSTDRKGCCKPQAANMDNGSGCCSAGPATSKNHHHESNIVDVTTKLSGCIDKPFPCCDDTCVERLAVIECHRQGARTLSTAKPAVQDAGK